MKRKLLAIALGVVTLLGPLPRPGPGHDHPAAASCGPDRAPVFCDPIHPLQIGVLLADVYQDKDSITYQTEEQGNDADEAKMEEKAKEEKSWEMLRDLVIIHEGKRSPRRGPNRPPSPN